MKNKKGEIATILTLGMILVGAVLTIATSFFANKTKNLASNPRALVVNDSVNSGPNANGGGITSTPTPTLIPTRTPTLTPTSTGRLGKRLGSGNAYLCQPNSNVNFMSYNLDGNGCDVERKICPNDALPFACVVVDDLCGGEPRYRWYGCTGQPCQNTKIKQAGHGPGVLVGIPAGMAKYDDSKCQSELATPTPKCAKEEEYSHPGLPCCDGLVVEVGSNYNVGRCVKKTTPPPRDGSPAAATTPGASSLTPTSPPILLTVMLTPPYLLPTCERGLTCTYAIKLDQMPECRTTHTHYCLNPSVSNYYSCCIPPSSTPPTSSPGSGTPAGGTSSRGEFGGLNQSCISSCNDYGVCTYGCFGNLVCTEQSPKGICVTPTPTPTKIVTPGVTVEVMPVGGSVVVIYDCGNPNLPPELKDGICKKEDGYTLDSDLTVVDEKGGTHVIPRATRITKKDNKITVRFITSEGKAICAMGSAVSAIVFSASVILTGGLSTPAVVALLAGIATVGTGGIVYCVTQ
jgi:hypothetical protein